MATETLEWHGPLFFCSRSGPTVLDAPQAQGPGVYLWTVQSPRGELPHYVGETGKSVARRHYEHFRDYAAGIYSVQAADAFAGGNARLLYEGPLWRRDAWRSTQVFIDRFPEFARELAGMIECIRIYVAPLELDQRTRRRIEGAIISALNVIPEAQRSLWSAGFRRWRREADEPPIEVRSVGNLPLSVLQEPLLA